MLSIKTICSMRKMKVISEANQIEIAKIYLEYGGSELGNIKVIQLIHEENKKLV